jgi:hypothetical protein
MDKFEVKDDHFARRVTVKKGVGKSATEKEVYQVCVYKRVPDAKTVKKRNADGELHDVDVAGWVVKPVVTMEVDTFLSIFKRVGTVDAVSDNL